LKLWQSRITRRCRSTIYKLAKLASILGVVLTLFGFGFTLYGLSKSKSAAERASAAAQETKKAILTTQTISNFASVVSVMEEVKRLHRAEAWEIVPDRYSYLRKTLLSIINTHDDLSDEHKRQLRSAVAQFRELEASVERYLSKRKTAPDSAKLNKIVTDQIDRLEEVLNMIKSKAN